MIRLKPSECRDIVCPPAHLVLVVAGQDRGEEFDVRVPAAQPPEGPKVTGGRPLLIETRRNAQGV